MSDLSLVPMDELVAEIDKRFDTVCLLTNKILNAKTDAPHYHFKDQIGCLGLLRIADLEIKKNYVSNDTGTYKEGGPA